MANTKPTKKRKREKPQQIDYIPKCFQQPRSRGPKPRTDFSLFFCSSSSSSHSFPGHRLHRGDMLEFSSCKDGLSSITTASVDQCCQTPVSRHQKEIPKLPLVRCSMSKIGEHERQFSNSMEVPFTKVEAVMQNALLGTCVDRNVGGHKSDAAGALEFTPNKSRTTESNDVWMAPGSVVWAKTAFQMWWPAEIIGERSAPVSPSNQSVDGHVLVQYYGNRECAWVDPARDLSQLEDCFEERSCNPVEAFQVALKQALNIKEHTGSCRRLDESPDGLSSIQHYQLSDKWNSSSSSRTEGDDLGGRGKRKRKPKVYFDEVTFPVKSVKKVRRLRIMRYLGLTAPIGSPFLLNSHMKTA
ncbi:hypothetical protein HHK36_019235 [Tetracentron sinense]|uniref:PWWP domain-containing protein n=1 Tax=Tetracentron sinense TaxID=13715 RepID=A0A834YVW6_TETSI|nr:hypothetical protein HHK36_019235 [Tetracentron sinense]